MQTTIAVSVTLKVNVEGDTPDELISSAVERAMDFADEAVSGPFHTLAERVTAKGRGISVEGATALVNRQALEAAFS